MKRRIAPQRRNPAVEWDDAFRLFEERLGGVRLEDLEDGDEQAADIAGRSLRKEMMKLLTQDAARGVDDNRREH